MSPGELLAAGSELLYREGYYLDRQQWQDWLALYTEDCVLWAPSWVGEHAQITDPQSEISLLYLNGRGRLLERVERFVSGASPASGRCHRPSNRPASVPASSCRRSSCPRPAARESSCHYRCKHPPEHCGAGS